METTRKSVDYLRRYTSIASAIHILQNKKITLLSPEKWDDRNDAYYLQKFAERQGYLTVLALCFARRSETFHHWKVFTNQTDGVCIEFSYSKLQLHLGAKTGVAWGDVKYREIDSVRRRPPNVEALPFLKRIPYKDEKEFRIVFCGKEKKISTLPIPIKLTCINKIIVNPWLNPALLPALKATFRGIAGCSGIPVQSTTLLSNKRWKEMAEEWMG